MSINASGSAPLNDNWRNFDALDLPTAQKEKNPLKGRLEGLDLAEKSAQITVTARKAQEYTKITGNSVLFPIKAASMPTYGPKIATTNSTDLTCKLMKEKINNEISGIIQDVEYNGLHLVTEFIQFYEQEHKKDSTKSCVEIFHRFDPDSTKEALTGGTTCAGKAQHVVASLAQLKPTGVKAYVIVNSEGPNQPPIHAAVAVPCKDGVLLIEVEHEIPILELKAAETYIRLYPGMPSKEHPKLTEPGHPDLTVSIQIVEAPGNYKMNSPMIVKRETFAGETETKKNGYAQFVLRPDSKPDQSVMKRWLAGTPFYPVSSTGKGPAQHAIKVNLSEGKYEGITFNIGDKKFRIPLSAFHQIPDPNNPNKLIRTIDRKALKGDEKLKLANEEMETYRDLILGNKDDSLGGEFFKAFKVSKELLMDQIFTIVANKTLLQDLRKNYKGSSDH